MEKTAEIATWWSELERLTRALGQVGPDEVCCEGLTTRQCGILRMLMAAEGARISDLALSVWLTPSAMTRAIERLEAEGLVKRVRGATGDGRAASVSVTPKGRRVRQRIDQLMQQRTATIVEAIPAASRQPVLNALRILNQSMENGPCCAFNAPAGRRKENCCHDEK